MARKVYSSPSINVSFDAGICIHSANCLNGLPQVFDLDSRPWISPDAAAADDIAAAVERCPSGALQYERLDGAPQEQADASTTVDPIPNGPLMVRGAIDVRGADGKVIRHDTRVTLCRCGGSVNKPFCDNTHRRNGFSAD